MFPRRSLAAHSQRGVALIITLAALVLISAIILVFFTESSLNRRISFSSAGQSRADFVAHAGMDTIVGDLRAEIAAGSTNSINGFTNTVNNITIYVPITNADAVPCRVAYQDTFTNVVKESVSLTNFWYGSSYHATAPVRSAANNNTATNSINGRYIDPSRWNAPYLLGTSLPTTFTPPDWVIVTRQGAITNYATMPAVAGSGGLADKTTTNLNYAVGRYAYVVYDEGGLLDVNVAGFPASAAAATPYYSAKRGVLPQVDLTSLLANAPVNDASASTDANALVQWRNAATISSSGGYTNYVFNNTNGFATVATGDQTFVSRQDLINYVINSGNTTIPPAALQYLGTFSRELNAPSYTPPPIGSASRPPTSSADGAAAAVVGEDDVFNPSLINTRVTTTSFTRYSDGQTANVGEPLIKYRFPLSWLSWLTYQGISTTAKTSSGAAVGASDVLSAFGLQWELSQETMPQGAPPTAPVAVNDWVYTGHPGDPGYNSANAASTIRTLSEVAASGREPDFFELLQAAMQLGSLGKPGGNTVAQVLAFDQNTYNQVIQIGANLIAQYQTASYPPLISFYGTQFAGIENLPYLHRVYETVYRMNGSGTVGVWYQPEVWNPHAGASSPPSLPDQFRFIVTGGSNSFAVFYSTTTGSSSTPPVSPLPPQVDTSLSAYLTSQGITFGSSGYNYGTPTFLCTPIATSPVAYPAGATASGNDTVSDPANNNLNFIGVCLGKATTVYDYRVTPTLTTPANNPNQVYYWESGVPQNVSFTLQYKNASRTWVTYDQWSSINTGGSTSDNSNPLGAATTPPDPSGAFQVYQPAYFSTVADPRTDRFGSLNSYDYVAPNSNTSRITAAEGYWATSPAAAVGEWPGWSNTGGGSGTPASPLLTIFTGCLSDNLSTSPTYYLDCDGILRPGDGAYTSGTSGNLSNGGYPQATDALNNTSSRPVILNRPFRSVAEMGYAFRDDPWKHLDFFTSQSGDAALLDLFCLNPTPPPPNPAQSTDPIPEAGRVDLNTQQAPVLQAVLEGAIKAEDDTVNLSSSEAGTLAANLVNLTSTSPLLNRSQLVTSWISSSSLNSYNSSPPDSTIKRRREAAIRALADVGNTRTWVLLIDVIAQSGRYAPTASNLNQFAVEGERRYWLHVAIDRYTGKVIAQWLEPVYE